MAGSDRTISKWLNPRCNSAAACRGWLLFAAPVPSQSDLPCPPGPRHGTIGKAGFAAVRQSGLSCTAKQNLMWQAKGDPCVTPCYVNKTFVGTVGGAAAGKCP